MKIRCSLDVGTTALGQCVIKDVTLPFTNRLTQQEASDIKGKSQIERKSAVHQLELTFSAPLRLVPQSIETDYFEVFEGKHSISP